MVQAVATAFTQNEESSSEEDDALLKKLTAEPVLPYLPSPPSLPSRPHLGDVIRLVFFDLYSGDLGRLWLSVGSQDLECFAASQFAVLYL